jgi:hypothetical protein
LLGDVYSHENTSGAVKPLNVIHMDSKKEILMPSQLLVAHRGHALSHFGLQWEVGGKFLIWPPNLSKN